MSAAGERVRFLASASRANVSNEGWFGYSPVDYPVRWPSRLQRIRQLPRVLRAANHAYSAELGD